MGGEKEEVGRKLAEAEAAKRAVGTELTTTQGRISNLESTNAELKGQLTSASRGKKAAEARAVELEGQLRAVQSELEEEKKKTKIGDTECSREWGKLQSEIDQVQRMIESLKTDESKLEGMLRGQPERLGRYNLLKGQFEAYKGVPRDCKDIISFARIANATGAIQLIRTQKPFFDLLNKDLESFGKRPNLGECIRKLEEIRSNASDTEKIGNTVDNILNTLRSMKASSNLDKTLLGFLHNKPDASKITDIEFEGWKSEMIAKYGAQDYNRIYREVLNQVAQSLEKVSISESDYKNAGKRLKWRNEVFITMNGKVRRMKELLNKADLTQGEITEMQGYKDGLCKSVEAVQISFPSNLREELRKLVNVYEDISGSVRVYVRINTHFVEGQKNEAITSWIEKKGGGDNCTDRVELQGKTVPYGPFFGVFMCATNKNVYQGITQAVPTNLCKSRGVINSALLRDSNITSTKGSWSCGLLISSSFFTKGNDKPGANTWFSWTTWYSAKAFKPSFSYTLWLSSMLNKAREEMAITNLLANS